jgi:predicted phage terminase large subunit-like protein
MAEKCRRSLRTFVEQAWHVLEPSTPFVPGLACDAICEHLQAVTEGRIADLGINVPPGTAKSLLAAVFWPAWVWIDHPEVRWIFSSYNGALAIRDSVKCRALIESAWYQERWGDRFQLREDQNEKKKFENDRTGYRVIATIGAGTGERGDVCVCDDPHSVDQAESDTERKTAVDWWNGSMSTRLNNFATGHKIVIMQRLHEADLSGDLIERGGYEWLVLPEEFEPETRCTTSIGWTDPRTEYHQLLWPEHRTREHVERLKVTLGSYRYAGQYQQNPRPAGGNIFKTWWFRYWQPAGANLPPVVVRNADGDELKIYPVDLPKEFDEMLLSWDLTFKDTKTADSVAGGAWASKGADRFLLDQTCGRMDFSKTIEAIRQMAEKWPQAHRKLIEDKANGSAALSMLQKSISGLIAVNPEGGKLSRAHAVSAIVESGHVFVPHPRLAPWVDGYLAELTIFPSGRHDDQVDQTTQALNRLSVGPCYGLTTYLEEKQAEIEAERLQAAEAWLTIGPGLRKNSDAKPAATGCPECSATCIALGACGDFICAQCGNQWGGPRRGADDRHGGRDPKVGKGAQPYNRVNFTRKPDQ